jgi:hypothetical protein
MGVQLSLGPIPFNYFLLILLSILIILKGEGNERWEVRLQRICWHISAAVSRLLSELQSVSDSRVE